MSGDLRRDVSRPPSPDTAKSEDNVSVQVNVDAASNRGRLVRHSRRSSRSRSLSKTPLPPSRARTADNSQSSAASSQQDRGQAEPAEHVLRDLITSTGSSNDALVDALQRLKRTREGESEDAPQPKRDKLFDELLEMEGTFRDDASDMATPAASAATRASVTDIGHIGHQTTAGQPSKTIPIHGDRSRPPRQARERTAAPAATAAGSQSRSPGTSQSATLGEDDRGKPEVREP